MVTKIIRCNGHIINLSVKAFLFGKNRKVLKDNGITNPETVQNEMVDWRKIGPLGKAHNIAIHSRRNPQRIKQFREFSGGILITKDNNTRWNSWYDMLVSLLRPEIRRAIDCYIAEHEGLEEDRLTRSEWKLLEKIRKILESFKIATLATEGADATLTKVLPSIDFLLNAYNQSLQEHNDDEILTSMIHIGKAKLNKYFNATDRSPIYLAAVVFNPRLKWRYFELKWKRTWISPAKKRLREYWITWKNNHESIKSANSNFIPTTSFDSTLDVSLSTLYEENDFTAWMDIGDPTRDEYDRYCANPEPEISVKDARVWWLEDRQQTEFPILAKWAISIHSIPAMSAEPERVFSGAKRTIGPHRHSLKKEAIEATECLKSWKKVQV